MIRLYKEFVEQLLFVLIYLRDARGNIRWSDIQSHLYNNWRHLGRSPHSTTDVVALVQEIFSDNKMLDGMDDLIDTLVKTIRVANQQTEGDKDLIDAMVRTLQLPYVRQKIDATLLQKLRAALLLPEEMAGLQERLKKEELYCGCGRKFVAGEMVAYTMGGDLQPKFQCINCFTPSYMPCQSGKHYMSLPTSTLKTLKKHMGVECEQCKDIALLSTEGDGPQPVGEEVERAAYALGGTAEIPMDLRELPTFGRSREGRILDAGIPRTPLDNTATITWTPPIYTWTDAIIGDGPTTQPAQQEAVTAIPEAAPTELRIEEAYQAVFNTATRRFVEEPHHIVAATTRRGNPFQGYDERRMQEAVAAEQAEQAVTDRNDHYRPYYQYNPPIRGNNNEPE